MVDYSDRLKQAMTRANMKTRALANRLGISYQAVRKVENGQSNAFSALNHAKAAQVLKVSATWLATGTGAMELTSHAPADSELDDEVAVKKMALLPLVGEVQGGDDGYLEELQYPVGHGEGFVEYPTNDPNAYALRVRGDSMHPRYRAGEFVIVEPNIEPQQGDDVVVRCTNGRKMLKQLNWQRDGEVQLLSINNGYAPITLQNSEVVSIQLASGRARRSALRTS